MNTGVEIARNGELITDVVHHCDALTLLRCLAPQSVDAIITDPPYGLGGRVFAFPHKNYTAINEAWDHHIPIDWMAAAGQAVKPSGCIVCFGVRQSIYHFAAEGLRLGWRMVNDVTWEKPDAPPNFTGRMLTESTERFLVFSPSGKGWTYNLARAKAINCGINFRDVWRFNIERAGRQHPAQKPIGLMERIISLFTATGDLVVDPFAGSGTTLVAAYQNGRRYIGSDMSAEYVEVARKRLAQPYTPSMFPEAV